MKKPVVLLFVVMVLALCAVPIVQSFKITRQKEELAMLRIRTEQAASELEQLRVANEKLESECRDLRFRVRDQAVRSASGEPPAVAARADDPSDSPSVDESQKPDQQKHPLGGMIAKMMEDPEMRRFVRNQQRQMMDPLYEPLIKRLGLTPEEAGAFKDFLADTQMSAADQAGSLFGGSTADRARAMESLTADQKDYEEQIKAFLGEDGFTQYKDYQETLGERMQLNQFKMQTAGGENALSDEQTEWLLTVMKEEKRNMAATTGQALPGAGQDQANLQAMFSDEMADQLIQAQESVNQRVYERAAAGLPPEQLEAFGRFQTNQLQMMRMGMSMARKMFAPEDAGGGSD